MRTVALLPVRNEGWVLRQALTCLSRFCDVVLVSDQASEDDSREIARDFDKVVLIENERPLICEAARFQLLDVARDYEGPKLLWMTDADELMSPPAVRRFLHDEFGAVAPGTAIELLWCQMWGDLAHYRNDGSPYAPQWKPMAFVDDGTSDYDRSGSLPLHRSRVPAPPNVPTHRAKDVAILHLQWLLERRNQAKQAWYRCSEWLDRKKEAAEINALYAPTLALRGVKTTRAPSAWTEGVPVPDLGVDEERSWQERQVLSWFDEHGIAFFEPLEIWHIRTFERLFRDRTGRAPRPDRSYMPGMTTRARRLASRVARSLRQAVTFD